MIFGGGASGGRAVNLAAPAVVAKARQTAKNKKTRQKQKVKPSAGAGRSQMAPPHLSMGSYGEL